MDCGRSHSQDEQWSWPRAFATLYSDCAELFRLGRHGHEHRLEALARLGGGERADELRTAFRYVDGTLEVDDGWRGHVERAHSARASS